MAFAPAWRRWAAARWSRAGGRRAASASPPERRRAPRAMSALERLKRRADFLRVADGRRKWVTPGLILQTLARASADDASDAVRVGFTATRKIGNAVIRNRARRRLRAAAASVMARHAAP